MKYDANLPPPPPQAVRRSTPDKDAAQADLEPHSGSTQSCRLGAFAGAVEPLACHRPASRIIPCSSSSTTSSCLHDCPSSSFLLPYCSLVLGIVSNFSPGRFRLQPRLPSDRQSQPLLGQTTRLNREGGDIETSLSFNLATESSGLVHFLPPARTVTAQKRLELAIALHWHRKILDRKDTRHFLLLALIP